MEKLTRLELSHIEQLLRYEHALYEKFHLYAEHADEDATRKLCEQLGDRSREHVEALIGVLEHEGTTYH